MRPDDAQDLHRRVLREYTASAGDYDRRWVRYNEHTLHEALSAIAPLPGTTLLDVGCGTGLLLERLSERRPGARFIGIDLVPAMLAVARARLRGAALLLRGDAAALPLRPATVDIVTSISMLHCLPDRSRAVAGFARALRPGGRLLLIDWRADAVRTRLLRRVLPLLGHAPVRPLTADGLQDLLARHGFTDVSLQPFSAGYAWAMMRVTATRGDQA